MNPERARELRDELRHRSHHHHGLTPHPGSSKHRELRFDRQHPGQVEQVRRLLAGVEGIEVGNVADEFSLSIRYDLTCYTLKGLETALISQGFHFHDSLFCKFRRALVYFLEETQLHNMRTPQRLIKKSNEVYVKAWEHHPHGDHDDTPADLREER